jgi:hypothetical protein
MLLTGRVHGPSCKSMTADAALPGNILLLPKITTRSRKKKATPSRKTASRARVRRTEKTAVGAVRTSKILRDLLEKNPDKSFTIEKIVNSIGGTSAFGTSLLVFSIPEVLPIPIPGISALVVIPTGIIAAQMIAGNGQLKLPKALLKRSIPRKALAASIHAILPFLEKTEKYVKPRWKWALHPASKRFIGLFVFILALAIALPVPGTNMPLAIAIFIIALGLIENDGMLITLGILIGIASFALLGGIILGALSLLGIV